MFELKVILYKLDSPGQPETWFKKEILINSKEDLIKLNGYQGHSVYGYVSDETGCEQGLGLDVLEFNFSRRRHFGPCIPTLAQFACLYFARGSQPRTKSPVCETEELRATVVLRYSRSVDI